MSDSSGFPQFPATPRTAEVPRAGDSGRESTGRITEIPRELSDIQDIARLKGEVIQARLDARTREIVLEVRTPQGDLEIRIPPEQPAPRIGQTVEIQIQPNPAPGQPPVDATIVVLDADERHQTPAPVNRTVTTPVDIQLGAQNNENTQAAPQPQNLQILLEQGSPIRLQPLSTAAAETILQPGPVQNTQTTITQTLINPIAIPNVQGLLFNESLSIPAQSAVVQPQTLPTTQKIVLNFNDPQPTPLPIEITRPSAQTIARALILNAQNPASAQTPNILQQPELLAQTPPTLPPATNPLQAFFTAPIDQLQNLQPAPVPATPHSFDVKLVSIQPPQVILSPPGETAPTNITPPKTEPLILQNQNIGIITGTVTGKTAENLSVINLHSAQAEGTRSFIIQAAIPDIVPGTQIQLSPEVTAQLASPAGIETNFTLPPFSYYLTPEIWPAMTELQQALTQTAPQIAQAFSNIVPNAGNAAQIPPAALFFIAAVRGGDLSAWLGDKALEALRRDGRGNLLSRITQEGGLLSRMAAEPITQDWRAMSLPMLYQNEIQKIALYYKHDHPDGQSDQQKGKQMRFIFDLNLDHMGKVQLDGLFHPGRLDLIVRTEYPFSQAMQMDMRQKYASALKHAETTGELSFQNQPEQWVTIQVEQDHFGVSA